jgi:archaetidylinositol phosphate synthase
MDEVRNDLNDRSGTIKPWDSRVASWLVRPLRDTWVHPNHLTTLSLVTGFSAGALYATGDATAAAWGGALYVLSALLDPADGELARLTEKTTPFGGESDRLSDLVARVALFLGVGLNLRTGPLGGWAVVCGIAGATSLVVAFSLRSDMARHGVSGSLDQPSAAGFDLNDALYLVAPLTWFGWLAPFVVGVGLGTPLFCLATARMRRRALAERA